MMKQPLVGRRVLIVEDEYVVASDLFKILERAGARVYGPVSDVERAMEIASTSQVGLNTAILDINLNGEMAYPVAAVLKARDVPFLFLTGYDRAAIPRQFRSAPYLIKPFEEVTLISQLASMVCIA